MRADADIRGRHMKEVSSSGDVYEAARQSGGDEQSHGGLTNAQP